MRRKSERTASKKGKASPEKKLEKVKRTRTSRRRKQSSSSENESADEASPVREVETVVEPEKIPPTTPAKEVSPEEALDQVWRVKTTETPGDIKKLKICLTRPPSTPERVDRSPRSKRKHSRATSSSDTPSVEGADEKKKTKHRSKRAPRGDSKDEGEKNDSQEEDLDHESGSQHDPDKSSDEVTQSETVEETETPMSTTNEDLKGTESENVIQSTQEEPESTESKKTVSEDTDKASDADTTVASPKDETRVASPPANVESDNQEAQPSNIVENKSPEHSVTTKKENPQRKRSQSVEKSEVLELHAEDSKCDSDNEAGQSKVESKELKEDSKEVPTVRQEEKLASEEQEVSKNNAESISKETDKDESEGGIATNKTDVVESSEKVVVEQNKRKMSTDSGNQPEKTVQEKSDQVPNQPKEKLNQEPNQAKDKLNQEPNQAKDKSDQEPTQAKDKSDQEPTQAKKTQRSDSVKSITEEPVANGQSAPVVVGRKRRWGSRSSKLTTQKSITISTDILNNIIPDVKPVEFDEVIEEKKHRRSEHQERIERPVLPKIIIDNTENVELKKELDENDKDPHTPKPRDLASIRKISIIKDNDSIITRPPSPPRHKQSCILYITNLVRPFTLPQLKNLLQRTGRLVENGFWIDRIKSKCFVQYETEDQAVETRHALHGVTWPVSNPKTLQVDFSTQEAFDKAKLNEELDTTPVSTIPGTVEDWLREQDMKRERGELEKPWERKAATREWDLGKNDKDKDNIKDNSKLRREERPMDKRRHRSPEKSPEPARKFKKKEEEAPAKLLDDLFRKTKTTPCIYWLPLSAETIAIKEEQRRQHMAEHERRLQELRRTHRRH